MTNDPIIKIEQLEKSFGDLRVLKGIDLSLIHIFLAAATVAARKNREILKRGMK